MGIYCITNTVNNKIYIGSSVFIQSRKLYHFNSLKNNKHVNKYLQSAYDKYGLESFKFEIIEIINNESELRQIEDDYIKIFEAANPLIGYNLMKDSKNYKTRYEKEHCKNISNANKGRPVKEETLKLIKDARKKQIDCGQIPVLQYSLLGEFIKEWASIGEACKELNLFSTNLCRTASGINLTCGGFKWKYKNEEEKRKVPMNKAGEKIKNKRASLMSQADYVKYST